MPNTKCAICAISLTSSNASKGKSAGDTHRGEPTRTEFDSHEQIVASVGSSPDSRTE